MITQQFNEAFVFLEVPPSKFSNLNKPVPNQQLACEHVRTKQLHLQGYFLQAQLTPQVVLNITQVPSLLVSHNLDGAGLPHHVEKALIYKNSTTDLLIYGHNINKHNKTCKHNPHNLNSFSFSVSNPHLWFKAFLIAFEPLNKSFWQHLSFQTKTQLSLTLSGLNFGNKISDGLVASLFNRPLPVIVADGTERDRATVVRNPSFLHDV